MSEEKLPKGWKLTDLFEIAEVQTGKKDANYATDDGEFYFFTCAMEPLRAPNYSYEGEVLLLPGNGANVGQVIYFNGKFEAYQRTYIVGNIKIEPRFLYYFFLAFWKEIGTSTQYGSATNYIKIGNFKDFKIINPPFPEQQRIVAKLDAVFGHLDRVREKLDRIPELLKNFRQQVLTQAVTGKLNIDLKVSDHLILESAITIGNETQIKPKGWKWRLLTEVAKLESGHTPRKSREDYWENGNIPWISLQDIRSAHGKIISETKYMPNKKGIENSSARILPEGTVCFSRDISVGFTTIMGREMATSQHFANWICGEELNNKYLLYAFMASRDYLIGEGKGTTVGTIYMPALKQMYILLPPKDIQIEIVRQIENLFEIADKIESQYQSLKAKIDQLPQAVLSKAFRGELVGQEVKEYVREIGELGMVAEGKDYFK
mgnify:CR=1 FL=1